MAVVKVGQIRSTLGRALSYISRTDKTDDGRLVSTDFGKWRGPGDAARRMMDDIRPTLRRNSVLAHHVIQSFSDTDMARLTPEKAHELGVELAEAITGGQYRYVVATHIDSGHLHNHIIICSRTLTPDHRALRMQKRTLGQWREMSDRICQEHGLAVLPEPTRGATRKSQGEFYAAMRGASDKQTLKTIILKDAARSTDMRDLARLLREDEVTLKWRGAHATYETEGGRYRDTSLGLAYSPGSLASLALGAPARSITFSDRLISTTRKGRDGHDTLTVWLPGTHRTERISLDRRCIVQTGTRTYRAFLPNDSPLPITGRDGRYARTMSATELVASFGTDPLETTSIPRAGRIEATGMSRAERESLTTTLLARARDTVLDNARRLGAIDEDSRFGVDLAHEEQALAAETQALREEYERLLAASKRPGSVDPDLLLAAEQEVEKKADELRRVRQWRRQTQADQSTRRSAHGRRLAR